ncbi:small membrane protein [Streptomyces albus]|uniref:Small membrane protein n=2 Tax=Streptomyces TaxID=1883 RepID=A0A0B5F4Z0_STRA4|nr:small membrane protein [Streptomyces albus]AOU80949.1 small membrane protein [Streptomyces albus]AYN36652.1 hypothetical protein DUI70_6158 [Streptomyces albus]
MLAIGLGFAGIAVLGVLAVRVFTEAQRLGQQVARATEEIGRASEELERAAMTAARAHGESLPTDLR